MAFIDAYRKDTGEKVRIPEHWIGHPELGKPFRKTPQQKARDNENQAADTSAKTPAGTAEKGK